MDDKRIPPARLPVLRVGVLVLCGVLLFRALAAEPFTVPTGSMAPAVIGDHKAIGCPRCGFPVVVGCRPDAGDAEETEQFWAGASCPNCGCDHLGLEQVRACVGDSVMVNKLAYAWRRPRRWEMAVFLAPCDKDKVFVKRIVGLPGERVLIRDGDVYVNGQLARKSMGELDALRLPVFDQDYLPGPDGWRSRWLADPPDAGAGRERVLRLNGVGDRHPQRLTYRHWSLDEQQEEPVRDTCAYDGGDQDQHPVHDFMVEADLILRAGRGWLKVILTDGHDEAAVRLAVGPHLESCLRAGAKECLLPGCRLRAGHTYHLEFAFADRRAQVAIDGQACAVFLDLPPAPRRLPVSRPLQLVAGGVDVDVHHLRLYRDVHYTASGQHGIDAPVQLGPGEYFVLGDNSPSSDDSRYWPRPAVPERNMIGRPFLVHFPRHVVYLNAWGRHWEWAGFDWERLRWLR